jgi:universal stress protein E
MQRFKNILLVFEPHPQTLDRAVALARTNRARLTVVAVIQELAGPTTVTVSGLPPLDLQQLVVQEYQERLKKIVEPLNGTGARINSRVLVGTPSLEIIREVIRHQHDLVMMTAEGHGGLRERLLGSTSMQLLRKCPCPVWVIKPTQRQPFARILAAVDPDPDDKVKDALNTTIMELASSLAAREKAKLHVVHAWSLFGETLLEGRGGVSADEVQRLLRHEAERHRQLVDALTAQYSAANPRLHFEKGDPDEVIPRVANSEHVELLVMGSVGRTGIAGLFIGNTAEKILNAVDCSVLAVKPAGFVCPVKVETSS